MIPLDYKNANRIDMPDEPPDGCGIIMLIVTFAALAYALFYIFKQLNI